MIDIIVAGYPKSGNTWVTRLVGELVGCPVVGFLGEEDNKSICEGLYRKSEFQCFKSHYQLHELQSIRTNTKKIIYVIRDPRDIVISGAAYFRIERWAYLVKFIKLFPKGEKIYKESLKPLFSPPHYRIERMVHAVLYGSKKIHWWIRIPWETHYKPYMENQCFFVKYEDLLCKPERECKRILKYLGLEREDHQIGKAIERQSFKKKKEAFLKNNEIGKANFMRIGKKEQWRQELSEEQKKMFRQILTKNLTQFEYPINDDI